LLPSILYTEVEVCNGRMALLSNGDDFGAIVMLAATAGFSFLCRGVRNGVSSSA